MSKNRGSKALIQRPSGNGKINNVLNNERETEKRLLDSIVEIALSARNFQKTQTSNFLRSKLTMK